MERAGYSRRASVGTESNYSPKSSSRRSERVTDDAFTEVTPETTVNAEREEAISRHAKRRPFLIVLAVVASALLLALALRKQLYPAAKSPAVKPQEVPKVKPAETPTVREEKVRDVPKVPEQQPVEEEWPKLELAAPPEVSEQQPAKSLDLLMEVEEQPLVLPEVTTLGVAGPPDEAEKQPPQTPELPELQLVEPSAVPEEEPTETPQLPVQEPTVAPELELAGPPEAPKQELIDVGGTPTEDPSRSPGPLMVEPAKPVHSPVRKEPPQMPEVPEKEPPQMLPKVSEMPKVEVVRPREVPRQEPSPPPVAPTTVVPTTVVSTQVVPSLESKKTSELPQLCGEEVEERQCRVIATESEETLCKRVFQQLIQAKIRELVNWAFNMPAPEGKMLYRTDLEHKKFEEAVIIDGVKFLFSAQFRILTPFYKPQEMADLLAQGVPELVEKCVSHGKDARRFSRFYVEHQVFGDMKRGQVTFSVAVGPEGL
ncbi:hypothetical protein Emed_006185 [Eimeria media]